MSKFRKKPVVIEAIQWKGNNHFEAREFMGFEELKTILWSAENKTDAVLIDTLEGQMMVKPFDWIIKGVKGEFYPCKPDIFAETYEPVE